MFQIRSEMIGQVGHLPCHSNLGPAISGADVVRGIEPHLLALIERAWNQASSDAAACKPGRQSSQGCREEQHSGFEDIETSNISEPAAGKAFDRKDGSDCGPGDALSSSSEPPTSGQGHEQQQQRQRQEGGSENFQGQDGQDEQHESKDNGDGDGDGAPVDEEQFTESLMDEAYEELRTAEEWEQFRMEDAELWTAREAEASRIRIRLLTATKDLASKEEIGTSPGEVTPEGGHGACESKLTPIEEEMERERQREEEKKAKAKRKKQEQKERKKGKSVGEPDVGESRAVPIPEPSPPEEGAEAAAAACVVAEAAAAAAAAAAAEASEAAAHNSPAATEAAPEVPAVSAPTANQEVKKQGKAKKKVEEGAKHDIAGAGIVVAPANASAAEAAAVPAQVSTGAVSAGEVKAMNKRERKNERRRLAAGQPAAGQGSLATSQAELPPHPGLADTEACPTPVATAPAFSASAISSAVHTVARVQAEPAVTMSHVPLPPQPAVAPAAPTWLPPHLALAMSRAPTAPVAAAAAKLAPAAPAPPIHHVAATPVRPAATMPMQPQSIPAMVNAIARPVAPAAAGSVPTPGRPTPAVSASLPAPTLPSYLPPGLVAALARPNISAEERAHLSMQAKQVQAQVAARGPAIQPAQAPAAPTKKVAKLRREERLDKECTMCLEVLPFVGFLPCKHRVMCRGCADKWIARKALCSHCSQPITGIEA